MVDIFIELITAAMAIGSITDASMYSPDFITIYGMAPDGRKYSISFQFEKVKSDAETNS